MKFATFISLVRASLAGGLLSLAGLLSAAEKPSPQVSVSLRGVAEPNVEQGEPWRVAVRLDLPRGSKETVELAPEAGSWADAITVALYSAAGNNAVARAETVGKSDSPRATLDAQHVAGGLWRFAPDAMQGVAPGNYVLRVRLSIETGSGWTGTVAAREIPITVVPAAAQPPSQRIVNRAQDLLILGKIQDAATTVDGGLRNSPRDYTLLKVRAEIAERAGNPLAAILCLNAATFSSGGKINAGQPPPEEIELRIRIEKSRRAIVASALPPPAWTWPPLEVLQVLSDEARKSGFVTALPLEPAKAARGEPAAPSVGAIPPAPPVRSEPMSASPSALSSAAAVTPPAASTPEPGELVPVAELIDATIIADTAGQWAASAVASSQYSSPGYAAAQATGAPNIPLGMAGDNKDAWCPGKKDIGEEWLELTFAQPVHATAVRVRQNNAPGAIAKVELIEPDGTPHLAWEGVDPFVPPAIREIAWFAVRVPKTSYLVAKVKVTLKLPTVPGWKQIDAVQLVGEGT